MINQLTFRNYLSRKWWRWFRSMFKWIITIYFLLDILFPMNNNRVNQNSEECSITYSGGGDVPAEVGVRVRSSWSRDPGRPPDWRIRRVTWPGPASWLEAAPVRIYTVYRDNIRSGVSSIGPVPPLQLETSSIMTSIYMIFGIEGVILVHSNNDESLEETM